MYYKHQRFEKAKASTLASTHKVELPETGLLDSIAMYLRITNAASMTSYAPHHIPHHITKIEVIGNTDKILYSLTGQQAIAKAYRKMGGLPAFKQNGYQGKSQDHLIPIFFGRKYKDGKYALDLSKYDKVELQVTNDYTTNEIVAASLSMETRLNTLVDSVEAHSKFLKQWEYDATKPSADASHVQKKLPSGGILRSLMIQLDPDLATLTSKVDEDPAGDSYNWKLWLKDRALTMIDARPRDIMRDEHLHIGMGHSALKIKPSTTQYEDYHWAEVFCVSTAPCGDSGDTTNVSVEDQRDRFQKLGFAGTPTIVQQLVQGVGLYHTFELPFFELDEEAEYLNLATYGPMEIDWYAHKEDNTHRIILEKPIGQGPSEFA